MAYIKYKELTKYFDFSKYISNDQLPKYTLDYVYEDETLLVCYKTFRDYGLFTDKKIVLFDNALSVSPFKKTYTIPYNNISSCSIIYRPSKVELSFDMDSGYQLRLKFVSMGIEDKIRLRLLYSCITRIIADQKPSKEIYEMLTENKIIVKKEK